MSPAAWVGVGLLGGAGALCRFFGARAFARHFGGRREIGTGFVNLTGAIAIGVLSGAGVRGDAFTLSAGAFLGAFTTFSSWMLDTHDLGLAEARLRQVLNLVVPLAAGLIAVAVSRSVAR